ncbi:MAG: hypothetical protein NVS4B3_21950 [Gemmatimonadaceae bacterium]
MAEFTFTDRSGVDAESTTEIESVHGLSSDTQADTSARRGSGRVRGVLRIIGGVIGAVAVLGASGGGYLWYKGRAGQPVESAMAAEMQRLRALPQFSKRLGEERVPPRDITAFVSDLARQGMHRLDDSVLVRAVSVNGKILDAASGSECAAIARRPVFAQVVSSPEAMTTVDSASAAQYVSLQFRGAAAELKQLPARQPSDSAVVGAMKMLLGGLAKPARDRLVKAVSNMGTASDADACWAVRTMYRGVRTSVEPHRSVLARAILVDP